MKRDDVIEAMARAQTQSLPVPTDEKPAVGGVVMGRAQLVRMYDAIHAAGLRVVPYEPTEAQLNAARDWSIAKYGVGVGNDGATGCYQAMIDAHDREGE